MDLLKRELERKKKRVEKAKATSGGRRFFRASDLRKHMEDAEDDTKETNIASRKRKESRSHIANNDSDDKEDAKKPKHLDAQGHHSQGGKKDGGADHLKSSNGDVENDTPSSAAAMSTEEVTRRLRNIGHPIKLFGETPADRLLRLRKALDEQKNVQAGLSEMEEFRLGSGHGIRNPFLMKDDDKEADAPLVVADKDKKPSGDGNDQSHNGKNAEQNTNNGNEEDANDPHKRVYKYFKGLLHQWEDDLALRPDTVKKSVAGRNETKTLKQCKDYIRPLFKLCKNRRIDDSLLAQLYKIVLFCEEEEFVKAHDTYMDVAIGRAAWPIGVTMVGIHARTGRAKIESSNVAHVMNSELQRKYLTSVKRLMSYAQKKSNADPSKKVVN